MFEILEPSFTSVFADSSKKPGVIKYLQAIENTTFTESKYLVINSLDWLQSLTQFFINVSYHILVASLTLMALF